MSFQVGDKAILKVSVGASHGPGDLIEAVVESEPVAGWHIANGKANVDWMNRHPEYFELVQDENVMYLKKNWSLSVNNENVEAYKQTLIALGYNWNQYCRGWRGQSFIRSDEANSNKVLFSNMTEDDHFEDIEEFLKFHFLPQKTESQLKLEELQKIIEDAQNKINELKEEIK